MEAPRDILQNAEQARERGNTDTAFELYELALSLALSQHDIAVASEICAAKSILSRRLATEATTTEERHRMIERATAEVKSSLLHARHAEFMRDLTALPLALLAQAKLRALKGDIEGAIQSLSDAPTYSLDSLPEAHRFESRLLYLQLERAILRLKNNEDAEADVLRLVDLLIKDTGPDSHYNIPVWVSGAYLALAEYWIDTSHATIDIQKAKQYLELCEDILKFDNRMLLRQKDFDRVQAKVLATAP